MSEGYDSVGLTSFLAIIQLRTTTGRFVVHDQIYSGENDRARPNVAVEGN